MFGCMCMRLDVFFCKQKTAYEMRISDWSSDVCSSDLTYIEKKGKLQLAPIQFRDEEHLFQIAQRIVNQVGRRVDQTTPLADARLKDGSRVNVIVPPLSLRGTAISIRKLDRKSTRLNSSH